MTGWLWVSKKLDLVVLPDDPAFDEIVWVGDVLHYRLTPPVWAWLWRAVSAYVDRRATKEQADEAMAQMHKVDAWMGSVFPLPVLRAAFDRAVKNDVDELPKPVVSLENLKGIDEEFAALNRELNDA